MHAYLQLTKEIDMEKIGLLVICKESDTHRSTMEASLDSTKRLVISFATVLHLKDNQFDVRSSLFSIQFLGPSNTIFDNGTFPKNSLTQ